MLTNQGKESNYVYLIEEGDFQITSRTSHQNDRPKDPFDNRVKRKEIFSTDVKIATIGTYEIIGLSDAIKGKPQQTSVKCIS